MSNILFCKHMEKPTNRLSLYALIICVLAILTVSLCESKWNETGNRAVLSWDVTGYYFYLPAGLIYKDFRKLEFKDSIMQKYNPSSSFYQAFQLENGDWLLQYPIGLSVLYSPGFAIGHLGAKIGGYPPDGFSKPYQFGIWIWSLLIAFLGLLLLRKFLLSYFSDKAVALTLLVLTLATNYMNYVAIDGAMAHNYAFTLYAAILFFTKKWYDHPSFKGSIIIGLLVGLAALVRPTDIVIAIVPLAFGVASLKMIPNTFSFLLKHWSKLLFAVLVMVMIGSIQFVYWKIYSGEWVYYTYKEYGFYWTRPYLKECLISFRKGWLVYTPVMIFALIGFIFLYKKWRPLFWFSLAFFVVNTYIIFSWDIWWYGGSFGQRAMVESYAILALPLAAFNESLIKSFWKIVIIPVFLFCTWLNLLQTYQLHSDNGGMDPEFMTEAYYWRIFGRTSVNNTDRKLLDTDEDFIKKRNNVNVVLKEDFESYRDTSNVRTGMAPNSNRAIFLNFDFQKSPVLEIDRNQIKGNWLRVKGKFYAPWKEWDMWKMPQLKIAFYDAEGKAVKERFIRISRFLPTEEWTEIWIDSKIPEESFETFKFWIDQTGSRTHLSADDFIVEIFDE